jgi:hypothetical protein
MIEIEQRVADAIYAAELEFDGHGDRYEHLARAAIAAIRGSTEGIGKETKVPA